MSKTKWTAKEKNLAWRLRSSEALEDIMNVIIAQIGFTLNVVKLVQNNMELIHPPEVLTPDVLSTHLTSFDLVSVRIKNWVLILKADFDFYLGPEAQPVPAVMLILRPQDGKYFVSVLSKV